MLLMPLLHMTLRETDAQEIQNLGIREIQFSIESMWLQYFLIF